MEASKLRKDHDENDSLDYYVNYPQHEFLFSDSSSPDSRAGVDTSNGDLMTVRAKTETSPSDGIEKNGNTLRHLNLLAVRGIHYVEYFVGRPSQKVKLAVSVNSDFIVFRCSSYDCPNEDCGFPTFNRFQSNTFTELGCDACFQTDSCISNRCIINGKEWTAFRARDAVDTELGSFDMLFGCQSSSSGFLETVEQSANGILGLSSAPSSFINQMYRSGIIDSTSFSMCFSRYNDRNLNNAGTLTLGGYRADFLTSPMVYIKNTAKDGKYTTVITNVYLRGGGGESANLDNNQKVVKLVFDKNTANAGPGTVIDTTYPGTLLNFAIGNSFKNEWYRLTGWFYSTNAISLTDEELLQLPTLLVQLETSLTDEQFASSETVLGMVGETLDPDSPLDGLLAIPATHYMLKQKDGKYKTMLSIEHLSGSVLGANAFQGRHLLFKTGYSTLNSYIGMAETEKCSDSDGELIDTEDEIISPASQSPTSVPIGTDVPTIQPELSQENKGFLGEGGVLSQWPILVGAASAFLLIVIGVIWCRKKQKKKKKARASADAIRDFDDNDSSSLVSYGLRSHLFSIASKKSGQRSIDPLQDEANTGQVSRDSGSRAQKMKDARKAHEESRNTGASRRPTVLAEAHPVRVSFSGRNGRESHDIPQVRAQPIGSAMANELDQSSLGYSAHSRAITTAEPVEPLSQNGQHNFQQRGSGSKSNSNLNSRSQRSVDQSNYGMDSTNHTSLSEQLKKPFLVKKGSGISSDDEELGTYYSGRSRKQARRQLELATGERSSRRRQTMDLSQGRTTQSATSSKKPNRRQTMDVSYSAGTQSERVSPSKERRNTINTNITSSKNAAAPNARRRQSMQMTSSSGGEFDSSSSRQRRQTMAMGATSEHRLPSQKRQTMAMGATSEHRMPKQKRQSIGHGMDQIQKSEHRLPTQRRRSIGHSMDQMQMSEHRLPTQKRRSIGHGMDRMHIPSPKAHGMNAPGQNRRASEDSSKAASRRSSNDHKKPRSTKAATLSKAKRRSSIEFSTGFPEIPPPRLPISEGTVIGMKDDQSAVSGLTDIGRSTHSTSRFNRRRESLPPSNINPKTFRQHGLPKSKSTFAGGSRNDRRESYTSTTGELTDESNPRHERRRSIGSSRLSSADSFETYQSRRHSLGSSSDEYQRDKISLYGEGYGMELNNSRHSSQSRRNSRDSRRSSTMEPIDEDLDGDPGKMGNALPRSRSSLESFAKYQMDREMRNRNLPAAPHYRIMPKGNNSMW